MNNVTTLKVLDLATPVETSFAEDGHTYTIAETFVPGVTSILNCLNKPFLVPWSAKMVWAALTGRHKEILGMTESEYEKCILQAKGAATKRSKDAKDSGSIAHDYFEQHIKARIGGQEGVIEFTEKNEEAARCISQFFEWEKKHKIVWLASELVLGSSKYQFAGKVDAVAFVDEVPTVIDFKTSNQCSEEYWLQLAGYTILLRENGANPLPVQRMIVRTPKDGTAFEEQARGIYEFDESIFLHLREVERWVGTNK